MANQSKMGEWVKLNVGGQQFVTSKSTLAKEPESMICRTVLGELPSLKDENGAILIDRSPKYFDAILNYLRMGEIMPDHDINVDALIQEAKFYGIMGLVEKYEHNLALIIDFLEVSDKDITCKLSKTLEEEMSKFFAQLGNVRRVTLRNYDPGLLVEVAFAKKEDVFKAQKWCRPLPNQNNYADSGPIVHLCGMSMSMQSARIFDFQLEKYL